MSIVSCLYYRLTSAVVKVCSCKPGGLPLTVLRGGGRGGGRQRGEGGREGGRE